MEIFKEKGPSLIVRVVIIKKRNLEFWGGGMFWELSAYSLGRRSSVLFVRVQSQPLSVFLRVAESQNVAKRSHLSFR